MSNLPFPGPSADPLPEDHKEHRKRTNRKHDPREQHPQHQEPVRKDPRQDLVPYAK